MATALDGCKQGLSGTPIMTADNGAVSVGKGTWSFRVSQAKFGHGEDQKAQTSTSLETFELGAQWCALLATGPGGCI